MSGDGYASPIAGGDGALVRDQLRSTNYVAGVSGWRIAADGSAEFSGATIRGDLQSANWVAGTSGWRLTNAGSAEFNGNLTAKGTIQSSNWVAGTTGWKLDNTGSAEFNGNLTAKGTIQSSNYVAGTAGWKLDNTGAIEIATATIRDDVLGGGQLNFEASAANTTRTIYGDLVDVSFGGLGLAMHSARTVSPFGKAAIGVQPDLISLYSTGDIELFSDHLGAGAAGGKTRFVGPVTASSLDPDTITDTAGRSTTSTTFVPILGVPSLTLPYPASGRVLVVGNYNGRHGTSATASAFLSFEIRDTSSGGTLRRSATDVGAGRSIGTTYMGQPVVGLATGLPTSGTMFVRPMFRSSTAASVAEFDNIILAVIPLL